MIRKHPHLPFTAEPITIDFSSVDNNRFFFKIRSKQNRLWKHNCLIKP